MPQKKIQTTGVADLRCAWHESWAKPKQNAIITGPLIGGIGKGRYGLILWADVGIWKFQQERIFQKNLIKSIVAIQKLSCEIIKILRICNTGKNNISYHKVQTITENLRVEITWKPPKSPTTSDGVGIMHLWTVHIRKSGRKRCFSQPETQHCYTNVFGK